MKEYNLPRGSGKTTRLIFISEYTGYPIVTMTKGHTECLKESAKLCGASIPEPIVFSDLIEDKCKPTPDEVLIDEVLVCLYMYLSQKGIGVSAVTYTDDQPMKV